MTLEEVMLIAVGVMILMGTYSSFVFMKTQVSYKIQESYGEEVLNYVISNIYKLIDLNLTDGYIMIELPDVIGEDYYIISKGVKKNDIMLKFNNGRILSKNAGISVFGQSASTDKWIMLNYYNNSIQLKGVNE
ncbi:MAG: hypothetical protein K0B02_03970 [DPANN group archaeon]|nr:hypothetical protein [DPANN group archaeon]